MKKKVKVAKPTKPRNKEIIGAICGDCEGLSRRALIKETDTSPARLCKDSKLGHKESSLACKSFSPDIFALSKDGRVALRQLASLVKKFDEKALRVVAATLVNEHRTRQSGLRFGQIIYVRYRGYAGSDYVSNFLKAYVLDSNNGMVRLMSSDGAASLTYEVPETGAFNGPVLYDSASFRPILKKMRELKKFHDPRGAQTSKRLQSEENPTFKVRKENDFDNMIVELDNALRSKPKKAKRRKPKGEDADFVDLRDMVDQLDSGYSVGALRSTDEDDDADAMELSSNLYRRRRVTDDSDRDGYVPSRPRRTRTKSKGVTTIEV